MPHMGEFTKKTHASLTAQADLHTPKLHASRHQDAGEDEINVANLSGELADEQKSAWTKVSGKPTTFSPAAHKSSHQNTGDDEISVEGLSGKLADEQDPTQGKIGQGHIHIETTMDDSVGQGTWVLDTIGAGFYNSPAANGDSLLFKAFLDKGTYTLGIIAYFGTDRGIVDFDIDGVEVASFDLYATAGYGRGTKTNISIAAAGIKTITMRVHGKNNSSSGYICDLKRFALWRTA